MKKLTKSQKIYLAAMGVAALALVWDQCSKPPETPAVDASALLVKPSAGSPETEKPDGKAQPSSGTAGLVFFPEDTTAVKPKARVGNGVRTAADARAAKNIASKNAAVENTVRIVIDATTDVPAESLQTRIQKIANNECLDISELQNPFSVPRSWSGAASTDVIKPEANSTTVDADLLSRRIREFKKEQARSIVVGPRGYVFINGQGLFVGESYGDFTLIAVEKDRAVFEIKGSQVSIPLVEDMKIQRRGAVIENTKASESSAKTALQSR